MNPAALAARRDAPAWAAILLGAALLCAVFAPEGTSAVSVWNSSTAYGHCWLVLPIAAWLLWERRGVLAGHPARPAPIMALAAVPLAVAWAVADLLGLMEGRQLAAIGFVLLLSLAALGWRLWWALSAAFLYLVFLVPFGAFITSTLQHLTASFVTTGLAALDIPFEADTFKIAIPEGVFFVAEACAGLRFLIASIAFGVLYAVTMFRSPWRRAAFIAAACVVPVVANGFRAFGIVLLGHVLGSAEAGAADHLIYGWIFFSTVIVLLALLGLPFREAPLPPAARTVAAPAGATPGRLAAACLPVVLLASVGPLLTARDDRPVAFTPGTPATPPGCAAEDAHGAPGVMVADFRCGQQFVEVTTTVLRRGTLPSRILDAARRPALSGLGEEASAETWTAPDPPHAPWVIARAQESSRLSAYAVRVGGVQVTGGLRDRWRMMRDVLERAAGEPPTALAVALQPGGVDGEALLKTVLAGLGRDPRVATGSP